MQKGLKSYFIIITMFAASLGYAQVTESSVSGDVQKTSTAYPIFSYGDKMVNSDEFMRVFNKNKRDEKTPTQAEIEEYLELYVKFKLKVEEAYARKMDTVPAFISELAGYRKQLAQPYLTDKTVTEMLIKEAFDRSQMEVNASHLLINCALDANPSDTLRAYQKVLGLKNRIDKGEKFADIASQYSEDPSAKSNKGNLGYFTAFQMIYPFENAAFTTPVGKVSNPIRTQFGYHLVSVADKRKSLGDIKVAHIMVKFYNEGQIDSVKPKIEAVYAKLQSGADWETIVNEYSEDFNTNSKGGELSWFNRTSNNIPPEFKDAAYKLKKDGDYSEPIQSKFGWHIIKRVSIKPMPTYEDSKGMLRRKVERDSRSELNKDVVVKRIKIENNFKELGGVASVQSSFDSTLLLGKYKKKAGSGKVICSIGDKEYKDNDFINYVTVNQTRSNKPLANVVADLYTNFVKQINLNYEESILENKYDDFKYIMKEYKDGILLFELTDNEVWSKAVEDSTGLQRFYNQSQNYRWAERADATIYSCKNAKVAKSAKKLLKKGKSTSDILEVLNAKDALSISSESSKIEKGANADLDKLTWQKGVYDLPADNGRAKFVVIKDVLPAGPKKLEENLGQATSDYQNYLEAQWIESLKVKYPIKVYSENVKKLYN